MENKYPTFDSIVEKAKEISNLRVPELRELADSIVAKYINEDNTLEENFLLRDLLLQSLCSEVSCSVYAQKIKTDTILLKNKKK